MFLASLWEGFFVHEKPIRPPYYPLSFSRIISTNYPSSHDKLHFCSIRSLEVKYLSLDQAGQQFSGNSCSRKIVINRTKYAGNRYVDTFYRPEHWR